ncbi:hypothetical protein UFOVP46_92 [uncultured Caudovirales phage]|uniref:Uncharacterized protein n=1 Tax=uncultured Caudovirales phage TaxID=2100421 RepID=A0A6J5KS85_9CAUD|nr:hypothetical protein UFOVP46_92 [uncultured Caudovirales phage]
MLKYLVEQIRIMEEIGIKSGARTEYYTGAKEAYEDLLMKLVNGDVDATL